MTTLRKPVLLVIRDGWGKNPDRSQDKFNAVFLAKKACDDALQAKYPHTLVSASGLDVGLPDGQMGNSEVGHENIGAGRIVDQELVRLNKLFSEKQLARNPVWHGAVARVKASPSAKLHVMGIVSDGGVHLDVERHFPRSVITDRIAPENIHRLIAQIQFLRGAA